jgi:flagellar motor switch protein FliN/FliY
MSEKVSKRDVIDDQSAQEVMLQELPQAGAEGKGLFNGNLSLIKSLKVKLEVRVGNVEVSVGELYSLKEKMVLKLDRGTNESVDILLDGKLVARGSLVAVEDNFGICITEITQQSAS